MAKVALDYVVLKDFSKGIDANPDKIAIPLGATPMCRNVRFTPNGGFYQRRGVGPLTFGDKATPMDPPGKPVASYYNYRSDSESLETFLSQHIITFNDGLMAFANDYAGSPAPLGRTPGASWSPLTAAAGDVTRYGVPSFAEWRQILYISTGNRARQAVPMVKWDGTAGANLGVAWSEDIAAPTEGNMPTARFLAAHNERMFCAYTFESGTAHPNRVRWSHPGKPEAWRSEDWIDIGGADEITGIAPLRDMLVIFKRNSTWALLGVGEDTFRVIQVSDSVGSTGEWAPGWQGGIVYWDPQIGLIGFDGSTPRHLFAPLQPFVTSRAISQCFGIVAVGNRVLVATDYTGWMADRLISQAVTWDSLVAANQTWQGLAQYSGGVTWDQMSVTHGAVAWTLTQDMGWTGMTLSHPVNKGIAALGIHKGRATSLGDVLAPQQVVIATADGNRRLLLGEQFDDGRDHWSDTETDPIDSWYLTPWLHGGLPAQVKRWKAPRIIQEADSPGELAIDVYYDFNHRSLRRVLVAGVRESLGEESFAVNKPGTIGRAKAVQLKIRPAGVRHWGVSQVVIPLHPRPMR